MTEAEPVPTHGAGGRNLDVKNADKNEVAQSASISEENIRLRKIGQAA